MTIDFESNESSGFDENLEGAKVYSENKNQIGEVSSILLDEEQIIIKNASQFEFKDKTKIFIFLPKYLEVLRKGWNSYDWAVEALTLNDELESYYPEKPAFTLSLFEFAHLRENQKQIFSQIGHRFSFMQGPPGTGKTTTLGAVAASFIKTFPRKRILLLSTTNLAVDQSLISVDDSVNKLFTSKATRVANVLIYRLGNNFIPKYYDERDYLLPTKNKNLIKKLSKVFKAMPDKNKILEYDNWQNTVENLREEIKTNSDDILTNSNLIAMTTTRALSILKTLKQIDKFDLVIFDEASQVGIVHSIMLSTLGKHILYTGDPEQLSPIVSSSQELAKTWLGKSIFSKISSHKKNFIFLDEQSRMTKDICSLVSNLFYDGKLIMAKYINNKQAWEEERKLTKHPMLNNESVSIVDCQESTWSAKYHGPIRYSSASKIVDLLANLDQDNTIILTPFRAQRSLISVFLKRAQIKTQVKTVHKTQGSEFLNVIFDPVDGSNKFLIDEKSHQLINVALSRAKSRLIIFLNGQDINNSLFGQIYNIVKYLGHTSLDIVDISDFILDSNLRSLASDKVVKIGNDMFNHVRIEGSGKNQHIVGINLQSGMEKKFLLSIIENKYKSNKNDL